MAGSKGRTTARLARARSVGLPARPFLFTLEQVAGLLSLTEEDFNRDFVYYFGRSEGRYRAGGDYVKAINIAPATADPVWRISEEDLLQWLTRKGYTVYH